MFNLQHNRQVWNYFYIIYKILQAGWSGQIRIWFHNVTSNVLCVLWHVFIRINKFVGFLAFLQTNLHLCVCVVRLIINVMIEFKSVRLWYSLN